MLEEMERLRAEVGLGDLLRHYGDLAAADKQVWHDRYAGLPGATHRELVRLHGELLAFGWIEQNTGSTVASLAGGAGACYRATSAGLKALKQLALEVAEVV